MIPDVFIIGATGFIGTNIALQTSEQGYTVRVFGLKNSIIKFIKVLRVEIA